MSQKPHVLVVGGGFAGLRLVQALNNVDVRITLIDKQNYHLFQPLLFQVATAGLSPEDIAYPIRAILRGQKNAVFRLAEAISIDFDAKSLKSSTGEISYDYLVLAAGGKTNFFGMDKLADACLGLKTLHDAVTVRNHILNVFELAEQEVDPEVRKALLTFVLTGGGPTGVESAGALSELIRLVLSKEYRNINFQDVRIILLEGGQRLLAGMPEELSAVTAKILTTQKRVEVCFDAVVTDFDGQVITLKNGERIHTRTLIWAAGVRAADLADGLGVKQARLARVVVKPTLQLENHPEVLVIGDLGIIEEQPLPMTATVALQQADAAAENIRKLLHKEEPAAFAYKDVGSMATIGRNAAVVRFGGLKFHGFLAWVLWKAVHVIRLVGFRNRLFVLVNWAWDYFLYERAVRLIFPPKVEKCREGNN